MPIDEGLPSFNYHVDGGMELPSSDCIDALRHEREMGGVPPSHPFMRLRVSGAVLKQTQHVIRWQ